MYTLCTDRIELEIDTQGGFISSFVLDGAERIQSKTPLFNIRFRDRAGKTYYIDSQKASACLISKNVFTYQGFEKPFDELTVKITLAKGENIILEIETQGALQVKKLMPNAVLIFIAPPSFEELEARLRGRHTESEDAIQKRLNSTKLEMENSKHFDYQVVNDNIDNAVKKLEEIILG